MQQIVSAVELGQKRQSNLYRDPGAHRQDARLRKRILAIQRLAHRVLGMRRKGLGLGLIGGNGAGVATTAFAVTLALAALGLPATAWADGGAGGGGGGCGGAGGIDSVTGAGGVGGNGNPNCGNNGGGGGGSGLTGGGQGGTAGSGASGGAGGTSQNRNGENGGAGENGGGGGGGAAGYGGSALPAVAVSGGRGGNGGAAADSNGDGGGGGGAGGGGAILTGADLGTLNVSVTGGNGGDGGYGYIYGGHGGAGGFGIFGADVTFNNSGSIAGGDGGGGGGGVYSGDGGSGGAGIVGSGLTIDNAGSIRGGKGGARDFGADNAGAGGAGIIGSDLSVTNSGRIEGGRSGVIWLPRADAITFTGGSNRLEIWNGSTITGNVDATAGANDTFALAGETDGSFDVTDIGAEAQYRGFEAFEKTGASTWILTGTTTAATPWTISQGILSISADGNLGSGALTLNGGTLRNTAAITMSRAVNFAVNSSLQTDADLTLTGIVSGARGLAKQGVGKLTLTGANTYSGGTTISSGTLSVGNDGALGTGNVNAYGGTIDIQNGVTLSNDISIGATFGLNVATGATGTYAGKLDNSLGDPAFLVKTGGGTLILTDDNAPDLGAILREGTVRTNVAGALGNAEITLDGGTLQAGATMTLSNRGIFMNAAGGTIDTNGYNLTLNGAIRDSGGSGQLTKTGAGTFLLREVSTYRGPTRISAGTFAAALPNAFSANSAMTVDTGATLDLNGLSQTIGSLAGNGLVTSSRASTTRLTTNGDDTSTSFSGVIEDGAGVVSLTKTGAGTLILSGANTFTGGTTVSNGTLRNTGTVGGVQNAAGATFVNDATGTAGAVTNAGSATNAGTIASLDNSGGTFHLADGTIIGTATLTGGTLKGVGTLGGLTVGTGATVTPGNSIGTLNVAGNVAFNAGSTYLVETDPAGASSDLIHATGTASLTGGTVEHIGLTGAYQLRSKYTILTADGGVSGKFDGATSVFAFLDPTLSYDANNVHLGLVRNDVDFSAAGRTPNQKATAAAIDSIGINAANPLYDAVALLPNDPGLIAGTFDQLSGEIHASAKGALIEDSRFLRDAASERIRSAFGAAGTADMLVMGYRDDGKLAMIDGAADRGQGPAFWTQAHGAFGSTGSDGNASQLEQFWTDVVFGADTAIADDWRLGVLAGYGRTGFAANDRKSSGVSDNYHLGAYGGGQVGDLGLRAGANYTWHNIATERRPAFAGFVDQPVGNYHAGTFQAFAEAGYQIDMQGIMFEPFANLAHVSLNTQGIREVGGAAALHAGSQTSDVTFTTLGLRASTAIALGTGTANLHGMVGWRHAFGDTTPQAVQAFAQGNAFTVLGTPIARDAALVEAGLDFELTPNASFGLSYNGQIAADASQHSFSAKLGVRF